MEYWSLSKEIKYLIIFNLYKFAIENLLNRLAIAQISPKYTLDIGFIHYQLMQKRVLFAYFKYLTNQFLPILGPFLSYQSKTLLMVIFEQRPYFHVCFYSSLHGWEIKLAFCLLTFCKGNESHISANITDFQIMKPIKVSLLKKCRWLKKGLQMLFFLVMKIFE